MRENLHLDDWKEITLGELGSTYNGLSGKTKNDFGRGKPFITYMNVFSDGKIDKDKVQYVQISKDENQNQVAYGDILFTTSSETPDEVGMSSVLLDKVDEVYLNSFCFGFRLNNFDILKPEFARYLFRSPSVRKTIITLAQGSTRFNLSKTALLSKLKLRLPKVPEQLKIAKILSTVDEKIEVIEAQINQTTELKKGLMQRLLSKGIGHTQFKTSSLGEVPSNWRVANIGKTMNLINGRAFKPEEWESEGLPIIRIQNLNNQEAPFNYTSKKIEEKYYVYEGDLLFAWSGSKGISFGARIWKRETGVLNQHIFKVEPIKELDKTYAYYVLRDVQAKIESHAHGFKASFVHVTKADLRTVEFPLPPLPEQEKIAQILSIVDEKYNSLLEKKKLFQELKKGLMQQLLTGKIRVNQTNNPHESTESKRILPIIECD